MIDLIINTQPGTSGQVEKLLIIGPLQHDAVHHTQPRQPQDPALQANASTSHRGHSCRTPDARSHTHTDEARDAEHFAHESIAGVSLERGPREASRECLAKGDARLVRMEWAGEISNPGADAPEIRGVHLARCGAVADVNRAGC